MKGLLTGLLTVLCLLPTASASQQLFSTPVARVLKVKGTVRIQDEEGKNRAAEVYGVVREDEQLIVRAEAEITLGFRVDGHMERLAGACQATVTKEKVVAPAARVERIQMPPKHRQLVAGAVKKLKPLSREGTRLLKGSHGKIPVRGDGPTSAGLQPIHTSLVLDLQPELAWPPVAGARQYQVTLSKPDGDEIWTVTVAKNMLKCDGERSLQSGTKYVWTVTADLGDESQRQAYRGEFQVATDPQRSDAKQVRELAAQSEIEYLVLAASWYESAGLLAEAIEVNRRVVELEPKSASACQTLAALYERAQRWQDAEDAWEKVDSILDERRGPARVRSLFDDG